jgi:hypothetical protein
MNKAPPAIIPLGAEPAPLLAPPATKPEPPGKPRGDGKPADRKPKAGKRNRFAPLNEFIGGPLANVKGRAAVAAWIVIFARTNRKTGLARISQVDLANRCGCKVRALRDALRELEALGLLEVRFKGHEFGGVSIYRLQTGKEKNP